MSSLLFKDSGVLFQHSELGEPMPCRDFNKDDELHRANEIRMHNPVAVAPYQPAETAVKSSYKEGFRRQSISSALFPAVQASISRHVLDQSRRFDLLFTGYGFIVARAECCA